MSQNGANRQVIDCPSCKLRFSVTLPKADLFNDLRSSVVVAAHAKPIRCICGKQMIPAFQAVEIRWVIIPITDEQAASMDDSQIIVPPMVVQ